jgi:hypothetical protein
LATSAASFLAAITSGSCWFTGVGGTYAGADIAPYVKFEVGAGAGVLEGVAAGVAALDLEAILASESSIGSLAIMPSIRMT